MHIVYAVTRSDEIGGAQIHVRDVATEMARRGHAVLVLAGGNGPLFRHLEERGIRYYRIPTLVRPIRPLKDVRALYQLFREFRRESPSLVSLHSSKAGLLGRVAAKLARIPAIFTAHGWSFTEGTPRMPRLAYMTLEKMAALFAKRVITVSHYDRNLALRCKVGKPDQLLTIHNGMPDVNKDLLATPETENVRIVMVARFSPPKDHQTLLQALGRIGLSEEWSLQLIGTGPNMGEIEHQIHELGLEGRVELTGEVDDVSQYLSKAQLFVLVSNWEGLPRSIIEAMRAGLPIVASNVGGVSEMVTGGKNGFLVEPGSIDQLSERLQELLSNPELRNYMGSQSRCYYEKEFRFEAMLQKTLAVYERIAR